MRIKKNCNARFSWGNSITLQIRMAKIRAASFFFYSFWAIGRQKTSFYGTPYYRVFRGQVKLENFKLKSWEFGVNKFKEFFITSFLMWKVIKDVLAGVKLYGRQIFNFQRSLYERPIYELNSKTCLFLTSFELLTTVETKFENLIFRPFPFFIINMSDGVREIDIWFTALTSSVSKYFFQPDRKYF